MPQQPAPLSVAVQPAAGEHRHRRAHADERLLVAVAVEEDLRSARRLSSRCRGRRPASSLARNSSIMKASRGDRRGVRVVGKQVAILVAQGQDAARLGADDRNALLGVGRQHRDVAPRQLARLVDQPLGEHRAAAAGAALLDDDLEPGRFQQLHRRHADPRVVVRRRRCRGNRRPCRASGAVPRVPLLRCLRQRSMKVRAANGESLRSGAHAERSLHRRVETETHAEVDERRHRRRRAGRDRGCGRRRESAAGAVRGLVVGQKLGLELGHVDAGRALGLARLAGQAEIEHVVDVFRGQDPGDRSVRPARTLRSALARPRVVSFSSLVAM